MRVRLISQARGLYSASAEYPCPEVNAARIEARAAVPIAVACSSIRRHCAWVSAAIAVASAAARNPSPARTTSAASLALANDRAVFTRAVTSFQTIVIGCQVLFLFLTVLPIPRRDNSRPGISLRSKFDYSEYLRHFPERHGDSELLPEVSEQLA